MSVSIKSLLDDKDESMWCYGIFLPYPTRLTLLMQDIALIVFDVLAIMMLSLFVMWLIVIVLLTVFLSKMGYETSKDSEHLGLI
jgi:hypothetical protein